MRILYGIQGTGNGHLSRAKELVPALQKHADVDVVLSGSNYQVEVPFSLDWKLSGVSLRYTKQGAVDYVNTIRNVRWGRFLADCRSLPVREYDLVISDFEPVTAWACRLAGVPCLGVGHQAAFHFQESPRPEKKDIVGSWVLDHYAPASAYIGFHFQSYHPSIFPPIIRSEIAAAKTRAGDNIVVYLPAYDTGALLAHFRRLSEYSWHIFAADTEHQYQVDRVRVSPVGSTFAEAVASARMVICSAGFELPAELLYLQKQFAVMPIKRHYEQACNAGALARLGVAVWHGLADVSSKHLEQVLDSSLSQPAQAAQVGEVVARILDQTL